MTPKNILFKVSGSIACFKSCAVISELVQLGHDVKVAASQGALKFVGAATFEGLTGHPVFSDIYEEGRNMDHIHLSEWADLAILCPASASTINQFAAGVGDQCLSSLFLSFDLKKPYLVAPAMNSKMLNHPATQAALKKLEGWGVQVLPTESGNLACGEVGLGRLLEPANIVRRILDVLEKEVRHETFKSFNDIRGNPRSH